MSKIDSNKKQKRESLFNTAFKLFTTKGWGKTSISDIVNEAGVAKGTFYLYFKDKYDIRNKLISHNSSEIFLKAANDLEKLDYKPGFEEQIIFLVDHIINQLNNDKSLLTFISKNLSWGVFKNALTSPTFSGDLNFKEVYQKMLDNADCKLKNPELMLFMIIELVSSTCYSIILYSAVKNIIEINKI